MKMTIGTTGFPSEELLFGGHGHALVVPGGGCEVFVFDVGVVDHVEVGVPFEFPDDAAFVEASFLVFVAHESYAVICNPLGIERNKKNRIQLVSAA